MLRLGMVCKQPLALALIATLTAFRTTRWNVQNDKADIQEDKAYAPIEKRTFRKTR